ncbi:MAG: phenylalanine--tRNA ligase subunit beta [Actinomycetota bacterium]
MRVSLGWLEEYVAVDVPIPKLAEMLDMSGTKVETVESPGEGIDGVVVAEVAGISEHPNADNLTLVDVKLESGDVERVVCGARNFAVGDRVPLATVGARLPGGLEIGERKIRGETSRGMLCSGMELGVSKDHSGILVLPIDAPMGADIVETLGLDDTIFEFEITPNRPDCMSMIGVAREVAALLGNELRIPADDLVASQDLESPVEVEIADPSGCPRYLARYIEGVRIGPSPSWMSRRLLAAGVRPISNVVDATNYVMLEMGQPLHAFDAALIKDQKIVVRRARKKERFTTLDGVGRELHQDDLLIADPEHAVAIAGVMGGEDSEVSDETEAVILESAYFDPDSISFTSRRHGLRTEASARFMRGADPEIVPLAAARAAKLISETAGGRVADRAVDAYPREIPRRRITLRPARSDALLGIAVTPDRQANYLRSIGLGVTESDGSIEVEVPGFRGDLTREVDLIEEVARLAGFDRLPSTIPPGRIGGLEPDQTVQRQVRRALVGMGVSEAWTNSFGSPRDNDDQGLPDDHPARRMVMLANPVSEDHPALRTSLIPNLLRSVARNVAHHAEGTALFEIARVYEPTGEQLPQEADVVAAAFCGHRAGKSWIRGEFAWDFFGAKGVIERLCLALRTPAPVFEPAAGMPFHPTRAASVLLAGTTWGALGEIHPEVCERFAVPEGTVVFELGLAPLLAALPGRPRIEDLPRFPANYIDLAVVVDESVPAGEVESVVAEVGAPEVTAVRLFDIYRGEQIPDGKKSLAYALEVRVPDRSVTDEEALAVRDRIVEALVGRVGGTLRG